jgi:hypothetical protein
VEQLIAFAQDRWFVLVVALVVVVIVVKIVKTFVKWLIVLAIVGGLLYYGANYKDKLIEWGGEVAGVAQEQVIKALENEAANATYRLNPDGTFTVQTKSLTIEGKPGADEVTIGYNGIKTTVKRNAFLNRFIEQAAKQNNLPQAP